MTSRLRVAVWQLVLGALHAQDPAAAPPGWTAGYDGGFFVRSSDGRNELNLEGLFQVDYAAFERSEVRTSEFEVRRLRPELAGRFANYLRFRVEPNFTEDDVELEEAWVGAELGGPDTLLMIGRMKAPFGLEEVRSRRHIHFPRFSILNQFSPAEDHGVFVNGRAFGRVLEYGVAAYNGTGGADTTSSKDVAARAMLHPWRDRAGDALQNLQFGVAATWGRQDAELAGDAILNAFDGATVLWAPDARLDGDRLRLGGELAWYRGPVMAQAEAILVQQDVRGAGGQDEVQFHGAYVDVAVVLTGEDTSFAGVTPRDPVGDGGAGAFVLAARASALELDRALRDLGLVQADTFTDRIRALELGLTWVLDRHALVRCAYAHCFYDDGVALGSRRFADEGALRIEWQMQF
jgi:phosphate-selective porin OprO and OprP